MGSPRRDSLASLPSVRSILTPAAPAFGWVSMKAMDWRMDSSPTMVSGLSSSTYSDSLDRMARLLARAKPRLWRLAIIFTSGKRGAR